MGPFLENEALEEAPGGCERLGFERVHEAVSDRNSGAIAQLERDVGPRAAAAHEGGEERQVLGVGPVALLEVRAPDMVPLEFDVPEFDARELSPEGVSVADAVRGDPVPDSFLVFLGHCGSSSAFGLPRVHIIFPDSAGL